MRMTTTSPNDLKLLAKGTVSTSINFPLVHNTQYTALEISKPPSLSSDKLSVLLFSVQDISGITQLGPQGFAVIFGTNVGDRAMTYQYRIEANKIVLFYDYVYEDATPTAPYSSGVMNYFIYYI